jgi:hypothetical protein
MPTAYEPDQLSPEENRHAMHYSTGPQILQFRNKPCPDEMTHGLRLFSGKRQLPSRS